MKPNAQKSLKCDYDPWNGNFFFCSEVSKNFWGSIFFTLKKVIFSPKKYLNQKISLCDFINMSTGTFLIFLVLAKWHLPFSTVKTSKTQHSYLLVCLISSAADVIDLVEYVNIDRIVKKIGINTLYAITSVSLIQFSVTLTATRKLNLNLTGFRLVLDIVLGSEIWSIFFVLLTQELPYLIVRLLIVSKLNINVTATLYFFILKNIALCILCVHRIERIIKEILRKNNKICNTLHLKNTK